MYNALQSIQAFEAGQSGRQDRERRDAYKSAGNALMAGDYTGGANALYGAGDLSGGLQLTQYGQQQSDMKRQMEEAAQQKALQQAYAFTQNLAAIPQEGRAAYIQQAWPQLQYIMPGMTADQAIATGIDDQSIQQSLSVYRTLMGEGPQQVEGKAINNRLVDPYTGKVMGDYSDPAGPMSTIGKLRADLDAGRITQAQFDQAVAGKPLVQVNTGNVGEGDRPIVDKPPKGYQRVWDPQSKTYRDMPIPGSEADISTEQDAFAAFQKIQTSGFTNDLINSEIDRAVENTSAWSTGWGNMLLKDLPQTQARTLNNAVTMIQANLSFDRLQQMRDESKTGGALGAVSEREIDLLQSTVQKLDTMTDPKELVRALETVRTQLNNIQNLRKQIYAQKYGGYVAGDGSGMITPTDGADLPPGFEVVQ